MSIASKSTYLSGQLTHNSYGEILQEFFNPSDVLLNGARAWDIQVINDDLYSRILAGGTLAFGES